MNIKMNLPARRIMFVVTGFLTDMRLCFSLEKRGALRGWDEVM